MDIILDCVQKMTDQAEKEDEKYSAQDKSPALTTAVTPPSPPPLHIKPLITDPPVYRVDSIFINGSCAIKLKKKERKIEKEKERCSIERILCSFNTQTKYTKV